MVRFVDHLGLALYNEGIEVTMVIPRFYLNPRPHYQERPFKFVFLPTIPIEVKGYYPALPTPALYRVIKESQLIIVNSLAFTTAYGLVLNKFAKAKMIEFVHADERIVLNQTEEIPSFVRHLLFRMMKAMTRKMDYFAIATNTFRKKTIAYGADPEKIFKVPFGNKKRPVEEHLVAELRQRYDLDPERLTVLYLGRLADEKNIDNIIEVLGRISLMELDVQIIVAGGGYRYESIRREIEKKDYQLVLTGRIPDDYLPPMYSLADIFFSPSDHESLCFTVIEAMSYHSVPVVNAKLTETELDESNSILIEDVHDVDSTIETMIPYIKRPKDLKPMLAKVEETVKQFTWKNFQNAWMDQIRKMFPKEFE